MTAPERIFIGLGSNLNHPQQQITDSLARLSAQSGIDLIKQSSLYRSGPWGVTDQPDFINAVAEIRFGDGPHHLLDRLLNIERAMGRAKLRRWGERVIDLDILAFGDRMVDSPRLSVPHPRLEQRSFVLIPWAEIAPEFYVPGLAPVSELAAQCTATDDLTRIT